MSTSHHNLIRFFLKLFALSMLSFGVVAQMSQVPLLTRSPNVEPNVMLVLDDSLSMDQDFIYQETSSTLWGGSVSSGNSGVEPPSSALTYASKSPQINRLYYDPSIRYRPRINADGTFQANGSTSSFGTSQVVYLYKGTGVFTNASNFNTYTIKSATTSYPKGPKRLDCAGTTCNFTEERLNWANWKAYYSTRLLAAQTGLGFAFRDLPTTFRLGWSKINKLAPSSGSSVVDSNVQSYSLSKSRFYTWLYGSHSLVGATPNRRAMDNVGKFFQRADSDGPWATTPRYSSTAIVTPSTIFSTEAASAHAQCRRSYTMLVTDGYWNDSAPSVGNVDDTSGSTILTPSGGSYAYSPARPFRDSSSNTLADVVMKYWASDLRTLDNRVPTIAGINESFWQNLSFYAIGFGVRGTLTPGTTTLAQLTSGALNWPAPTSLQPSTIDDLYHATVNGRGQFLNASNTDELSDAVEGMMNQISRISSSQSGVAVSTANLTAGTRKFIPQYTTSDWTGNVTARVLNPLTGVEVSTAWAVESRTTGTPSVSISTIPSHTARTLVTWATATAVPFTHSAMSSSGVLGSFTGTVTTALIDYLRGSAANEGETGIYRTRAARLGDIVNSSPVFIKGNFDAGYQNLTTTMAERSTYASFVTNKASRNGVLFVGSNDGFVHGFRDSDGAEVFGYAPRAVLPNMHLLAEKTYSHRYFVDGPLRETDGYWDSAWRNVLIGTTGAGAKAVFALDVTNPTSMTTTNVLWEVNNTTTGFSELGHVLSDVQAGPTVGGQWVAIFGNGYLSTSGSARLYVVNLKTGALIRMLDAGKGPNNGLSGLRLVRNAERQIIGAYAGDLKGNIWKFDLSSSSSASWSVAFGGSPLYQASGPGGVTQSVTATPALVNHPNGGVVVAFGTGKFYQDSDVTTTAVQTAYGIWDSVPFGTTTVPAGSTLTGLTSLVQQTVSSAIGVTVTVTNPDGSTVSQVVSHFSISNNPVNWATKKGWYWNMPYSGQRLVYPVETLFAQFARFETIQPDVGTTNVCLQAGQGTGYNYVVDLLTGGAPVASIFDVNGDGKAGDDDMAAGRILNGYTTSADGRNIAVRVGSRSTAGGYGVPSPDGSIVQNPPTPTPPPVDATETMVDAGGGSPDTKEIIFDLCKLGLGPCQTAGSPSGIKSRSWRQLFMR
jgi:type IV pilus assembly protein PilY1